MRFPHLLVVGVFFFATIFAHADGTLLGNLNTNNGGQGLVSSTERRGATFTTSGTAFSISSVTFRLTDYISDDDDAIVTLNAGTNSAPGAVVGSFLAPPSASDDPDNFVFTADGEITLAANTLYWLVISAANNTDTFSWIRSEPVVVPTGTFTFGQQKISQNSGSSWSEGSNGPHTFAITGSAVPEPATVLFTGLGFTMLLFAARRRRA